MTDIVARLRTHPGEKLTVTEQFRNMVEQRHEAADEIEQLRAELDIAKRAANVTQGLWQSSEKECAELRAEIERLRAALQRIADMPLTAGAATFARRSLEPKP